MLYVSIIEQARRQAGQVLDRYAKIAVWRGVFGRVMAGSNQGDREYANDSRPGKCTERPQTSQSLYFHPCMILPL
jgi:hypothetical protein